VDVARRARLTTISTSLRSRGQHLHQSLDGEAAIPAL
jgi:hypothetical protein